MCYVPAGACLQTRDATSRREKAAHHAHGHCSSPVPAVLGPALVIGRCMRMVRRPRGSIKHRAAQAARVLCSGSCSRAGARNG